MLGEGLEVISVGVGFRSWGIVREGVDEEDEEGGREGSKRGRSTVREGSAISA